MEAGLTAAPRGGGDRALLMLSGAHLYWASVPGKESGLSDITPVYRRPDRPVSARVEDLLARMTLEEKLGQINMPLGVPPRSLPGTLEETERLVTGDLEEGLGPLGGFFGLTEGPLRCPPEEQVELTRNLQRLARERTRLGIPLLQIAEGCHGVIVPGATIFPEGPSLGSTWNPKLVAEVFQAVAREARAVGMHMLCTLVVEPIRDPRMGRNCEGYSEDPMLCRDFAFAIVEGTQGGDLSASDAAAAALTCFPGQSEPASGLERGAMDMSERTLRQAFLPPWTAVSGHDGALAVMATYAAIDGVPAHASEYWLTDVLRGELGFEGIVLSEGFGFETIQYEGIAETQKEAGVLALRAGVDVNITYERAFMQPLLEAIAEGQVGEDLLDRAVGRVLNAKFRLGLFDRSDEPGNVDEIVHSDEHVALAERAAREGITLLKNDGDLLPLNKDLRRVAVIGPNSNSGRALLGDYVVSEVSQPVETIAEAIRRTLGPDVDVTHEQGCDITDPDRSGLAQAAEAARAADVAIVVVGERSAKNEEPYRTNSDGGAPAWADQFHGGTYAQPTIGEPFDVQSLDLSGAQEELVRAIHATGAPTVLVLVNGRALSVRWASENVPAIVEAWLPGERGAAAVVDVLFGDSEPLGRLPVTIPAHVGQLPCYYNAKPSKAYWLTHGWSGTGGWVDGPAEPLYPFGHGLSYTEFSYANLRIAENPEPPALAAVSATVRNVGAKAGTEVVQLYVRDRFATAATPSMELRGYHKVQLEPGETRVVEFSLEAADLALIDARGQLVVEPGVFDIMVGASSGDIRLRGAFAVSEGLTLEGRIPLRVPRD